MVLQHLTCCCIWDSPKQNKGAAPRPVAPVYHCRWLSAISVARPPPPFGGELIKICIIAWLQHRLLDWEEWKLFCFLFSDIHVIRRWSPHSDTGAFCVSGGGSLRADLES